MKSIIGRFRENFIKRSLKKKYAHQLQRQNDLSINTQEGHNDHTRVVNSRYLINQGIEPTEANLLKLQEETKAWIKEEQEKNPPKPIGRVPAYVADQPERFTVFTEEEFLREREVGEIVKIIGETRIGTWDHRLIGRVFDRVYGWGNSFKFALAGVYQMGYIYGVRAERKRKLRRCG